MQQNTDKIKVNMKQQDEQSQWSLSSIEQLKGLDLNQLKQQEERQQCVKEKEDGQIHTKQKPKIQPKFPPKQQINSESKLYEVGKVFQKVGQLLIIQANSCVNLADLDNWLFDQNRQCIGFVIDIFGRVDHPYYAIQLCQNVKDKLNFDNITQLTLYYAQGCKTLTQEDIKSIKEKSSMNKQPENDDISSESQNQNSQQNVHSNMVFTKRHPPKRRASFQQQPYHRERTRQKRHFNHQRHNPHQDNRRRYQGQRNQIRNQARDRQHNQLYLQNMYNAYYHQMMQLYNGQNGMPLPKPPVFPMFQYQPQQNQPHPPPNSHQRPPQ